MAKKTPDLSAPSRVFDELEHKYYPSPKVMEDILHFLVHHEFNKAGKKKKDDPLAAVRQKTTARPYYDTPDLLLYKHPRRISVRTELKAAPGSVAHYEQTLKFDLAPAQPLPEGTVFRREVKNWVLTPRPDLSVVTDPEARGVLKGFSNNDLVNVFTPLICRRYLEIEWRKSVLEPAFDVGHIFVPSTGLCRPFLEAELECKKGDPAAVQELRGLIFDRFDVGNGKGYSKQEAGVRAYLGL